MYMLFYNGRKTVDEHMEDWGIVGPLVGPLKFVQVTYGCHLRFTFEDSRDAEKFGLDPKEGIQHLTYVDDLIPLGGVLYGDISIANNPA